MSEQTPRINALLLQQFQGKTIRVTGKVMEIRGNQAKLDSRGTVIATLDRDSAIIVGNAAELIGKVNPDLSLRVFASKDFGSNIDYDVLDSLVDITHKHKEIFYDS